MAATRKNARYRMDGWQNVVNGLGIQNQDKMMTAKFALRQPLSQDQLTNLYRQSWVCRRIVNELVKDGTRAGFQIEFDQDPDASAKIMAAWDRLGYKWLAEGFRWAKVYGGSVGLIMTDGELLSPDLATALMEPLDRKKVNRIASILVIDARYVLPSLSYVTIDPTSPNFGKPEVYTATPFLYGGVLPQFSVHWSRLVRFEGEEVDALTRVANRSWGDSIYEAVYEAVRQHGTVMAATSVTAAEFTQGVLKIKDLALNLGSDQSGAIVNRLQAFKMMLGSTGMAAIDAEMETFERLGQPVTGLPDLIDAFKDEACGAVGMPRSRLYGNQSGKLAGAEMDHNVWAENVHGQQQATIGDPIRYITRILCDIEGIEGEFKITFNDIAAPDIDKQVAREKVQADTDKIYYEMNALEASEIRQARWGGTAYSHKTTLDPAVTKSLAEAEEAAREAPEVTEEAETEEEGETNATAAA